MTSRLSSPLAITGAGAVTPVGPSAARTCAALRAGLSAFAEYPLFRPATRDPGWDPEEPLRAARAPNIDPRVSGPARLIELSSGALGDLFRDAGLRRDDLARAGLLVALPASDPATERWGSPEGFVQALCRRTGLTSFATPRTSASGHTGAIELLAEASALLSSGDVSCCILLAVDSYLSPDRLAYLDGEHRLKSDRNVDGFIPGEAAVALLLETPARARARRVRVRAVAASVGFGVEPETLRSESQSTGAGLAAALRAVLPDDRPDLSSSISCDLNGEHYRGFEWGVVAARLGERLGGVARLMHPADCVGDVGAASGALLIALAAAGLERAHPPSPRAIVWCASDGALRAATRIEQAA
jgi:3-oxoacyl-[acyl-carrier-protein] synthase-1